MKEVTDLIHWWTAQAATAASADPTAEHGCLAPVEEEAAGATAAVGE